MISPAGIVSTVEPLPAEGLFRPIGIAINEAGVLYVTDERGRIVEITPGVAAGRWRARRRATRMAQDQARAFGHRPD